MNLRSILSSSAVIFSLSLSSVSFADTSVWKVSKADNYFYLGGTIHLLSKDDHPLPEEFAEAYKDASEIYFETDLDAANSPAFQAKFMAAATFSDDRTLSSELNSETFKKLESFMASRSIPIANFAKFQPWGVTLILSVMEYQRLGMMPDYGVDAYFKKLATADGKEVKALESVDEQLKFLSSMAKVESNEMIESSLRDLERMPEFVEKMKKNWKFGEMDKLSENSMVKKMKDEFPQVYRALLTTRNNNWMEQLPELFDDLDKEFVLVGALHLSGEDGLLKLLKQKGFSVEQL